MNTPPLYTTRFAFEGEVSLPGRQALKARHKAPVHIYAFPNGQGGNRYVVCTERGLRQVRAVYQMGGPGISVPPSDWTEEVKARVAVLSNWVVRVMSTGKIDTVREYNFI